MSETTSFPPVNHFFRELGVRVRTLEGREVGTLLLGPHLDTGDGVIPVGALVTLIDMVTGRTAQRAAAPRYPITSDIDLRLTARRPCEELLVTATALHTGSRSCVLEAEIRGRTGTTFVALGTAQANFSMFPPPKDLPLGSITTLSEEIDFRAGEHPPAPSLTEALRVRDGSPEAGTSELDVDDYVRNPVGVLQGGVHGILAERAALRFAKSQGSGTAQIGEMSLRYLAAARVGPVRTQVRALGPDSLLRVDLLDTGQDEKRVTTALVGLR
jgi:acyl-coenzyme A thioesterase PaaI-like protein